ncbi:hypothetical protein AKO1_001555 [Acrasis kona]|uniref:Uncharacterized protein n=1 Tax=Acrasis kona TaxID=1008807 RepID=A0AAW2ZBH3_9EUKA
MPSTKELHTDVRNNIFTERSINIKTLDLNCYELYTLPNGREIIRRVEDEACRIRPSTQAYYIKLGLLTKDAQIEYLHNERIQWDEVPGFSDDEEECDFDQQHNYTVYDDSFYRSLSERNKDETEKNKHRILNLNHYEPYTLPNGREIIRRAEDEACRIRPSTQAYYIKLGLLTKDAQIEYLHNERIQWDEVPGFSDDEDYFEPEGHLYN